MPIYNLEQIFIFECCQEQMITSKRIKLQTSNTTHLKENFKTFLTLIWFLYLHILDVEKKSISIKVHEFRFWFGRNLNGHIWELIMAKPLKPLTYITSQLKDLFKTFPTVIWFLHLHDFNVEKYVLLLMPMNSGVD